MVEPLPVLGQCEILRMGLGEALGQLDGVQAVVGAEGPPGAVPPREGDPRLRGQSGIIIMRNVQRRTVAGVAVDDPSLRIRPFGDVDGGKSPLLPFRHDGADLAGKVVADTCEPFEKIEDAVERGALELRPLSSVASGDEDFVAVGFDEEAVPVEFFRLQAQLFRFRTAPQVERGHVPRSSSDDPRLRPRDLVQAGDQLLDRRVDGGLLRFHHFDVGLALLAQGDLRGVPDPDDARRDGVRLERRGILRSRRKDGGGRREQRGPEKYSFNVHESSLISKLFGIRR